MLSGRQGPLLASTFQELKAELIHNRIQQVLKKLYSSLFPRPPSLATSGRRTWDRDLEVTASSKVLHTELNNKLLGSMLLLTGLLLALLH